MTPRAPVRVLTVFGTRPEAIKMAPLVSALSEDEFFDSRICVTGQHRWMLDQALEVFGIVPDIDLNIMKPGQDLFDVTCAALLGLREVLRAEEPDLVLVHGDTTSALAASMAALYSYIRVGHVEAGLRTFNLQAPFPEEFNRQVVAKASTWHFAPTETGRRNLLAEGVDPECVIVTGNTVIDALQFVLGRIRREPQRREAIDGLLTGQLSFDFAAERFVLVTGHRRENFGVADACDLPLDPGIGAQISVGAFRLSGPHESERAGPCP